MFNNLADRFDSIFKALKKTGSIDESALDNSMRDIRRALLEADVSLPVVKDFIDQVKKEALGKEVLSSISPKFSASILRYDNNGEPLSSLSSSI